MLRILHEVTFDFLQTKPNFRNRYAISVGTSLRKSVHFRDSMTQFQGGINRRPYFVAKRLNALNYHSTLEFSGLITNQASDFENTKWRTQYGGQFFKNLTFSRGIFGLLVTNLKADFTTLKIQYRKQFLENLTDPLQTRCLSVSFWF